MFQFDLLFVLRKVFEFPLGDDRQKTFPSSKVRALPQAEIFMSNGASKNLNISDLVIFEQLLKASRLPSDTPVRNHSFDRNDYSVALQGYHNPVAISCARFSLNSQRPTKHHKGATKDNKGLTKHRKVRQRI